MADISDRVEQDAALLARIIDTQNDVAAVQLDLPLVMNMIAERTARLTGAEGAVIEIVEGEETVYHAGSGIGATYVGQRLKIHSSLSGACVLTGVPVNCPDVLVDPRVNQALAAVAGLRAMLAVPLPHNGRVVGVVKVISTRPGAFKERDIFALQMMAGLCASSLSHASEFAVKQRLLAERTEALAALRASEQEFRTIFELAGVGKAQFDLRTGRVLRANPCFCEMLGYAPGELEGMHASQVTHPDDLPENLAIVEEMRAGKRDAATFEKRYLRRDGSVLWALVNSAVIRGREPGDLRTVTTVQDITARKRNEHLERDRRRVLEMVARNTPLPEVLDALSDALQHQIDGAVAAVFALEEGELRLHASGCPRDWARALRQHGVRLAPALAAGCTGDGPHACGVTSIEHDAAWAPLRELALPLGLTSCWTLRIASTDGSALGLITLFIPARRTPTEPEVENLGLFANLATICIEHHLASRQLTHLVRHDLLTALPNRLMLADRVAGAIEQVDQRRGMAAMFVLDIDRFKHINDTLGHHVGDELLQKFAARMRGQLGPGDTLARTGGDEFVVLLPGIASKQDAIEVAERLIHSLKTPFQLNGQSLAVTSSIGIAYYPADARDAASLQAQADEALYRAKRAGRCRWSV